MEVDVEEPRHVLGALDVARRPVQRLGDPAQHQAEHPGVLAAAALGGVDDERPRPERRARQPARDDARRVGARQHEGAQVDVAATQLAVDERRVPRERDRRLRDVVARIGDDQPTELVALGRGRRRSDQHPVAARLVDRLDDELLEMVEHVRALGRRRSGGRSGRSRGSAPRRGRSGSSPARTGRSPCRRRRRCRSRWRG